MDGERLREIEERAAKATPGPWKPNLDVSDPDEPEIEADVMDDNLTVYFTSGTDIVCREQEDWRRAGESRAYKDAEFIAHAREDVPALVDEVRRLREALEFYADRGLYRRAGWDLDLPIEDDAGARARRALGMKAS